MMSYQELVRQLAQDSSGSGVTEEHLRDLVYAQLSCDLPLLDFDGAARGVRAVARALASPSPALAVTPKVAANVAALAAADGPARAALQALAVAVLRRVLCWATDPSARPTCAPAFCGSPPSECSDSSNSKGESESESESKDEECEFEPFDIPDDSDPFGVCAAAALAEDEDAASLDDAAVLGALGCLCSPEALGLPSALDTRDGSALAAELVAAVNVFADAASTADATRAFHQRCLDTVVALVRDATCTPRPSAAAAQLLGQLTATLAAAPLRTEPRTLALLSVLAQAARAGHLACVVPHLPSVVALLGGNQEQEQQEEQQKELLGSRVTAAVAELITALGATGAARVVHGAGLDGAALAQCARQMRGPAGCTAATAALQAAVREGVCCRLRSAFVALAPDGTHDALEWDLLRSLLTGDAALAAAVQEPLRELLAPAAVESVRGTLAERVLRELVCVWQHWAPAPVLAPALRAVLEDALALCRRRAAGSGESVTPLALDAAHAPEQEQECREKSQARYARMQKMLLVVLHERKTD